MSDPLIRACDNYVVIEPGKQEKCLTAEETLLWLKGWLEELEDLPQDLQNEASTTSAALRLLDTACDFEVKPGFKIQWFAIRLNPPET